MTDELYWPFRCEHGHRFDYGPIHNSDDLQETDDTISTKPGSGRKADVPEEVHGCPECAEELGVAAGFEVVARPVKSGKAIRRADG